MAGVFHAVGGDDEQRAVGHILRTGVFVDVADVVDGVANGVHQRRAAAYLVIRVSHGRHLLYLHTVMQYAAEVVEQHGGYIGRARFLLLLFQHGVEATDGVALQSGHGAAAVKNKYQLCYIVHQ